MSVEQETCTPVASCDIRSATTHRLQARADPQGLILYCKYEKVSYRLTWEVLHRLEQEMQHGDRLTLLLKTLIP